MVAIDGRSLLHLTPDKFYDVIKPLRLAKLLLHPHYSGGGGLLMGTLIDKRPRNFRDLRL